MMSVMSGVCYQRKYHLTMIDKWLSDAFESLDSIEGRYEFVFVLYVVTLIRCHIELHHLLVD